VIGAPFLVLGLLLVLAALAGGHVGSRDRGVVGAFVLSPLDPVSWRATGAILLGLLTSVGSFALLASVFSAGASLLVVGVGAVLFGVAIEGARVVARIERWRVSLADPRPLPAHAYRPYGSGIAELLLAVFADRNRWRDVVYVVVAFPLALLQVVAVLVLWGAAIVLLTVPLWVAGGGLLVWPGAGGLAGIDPWGRDVWFGGAGALTAGLLLLCVAASVSRGLMALHRSVVAGLLCESEQRALQRRVATLEQSRRAVLDVEVTELNRIERDLHDGAQQRLVGLTIDLSLAAERIDDDPEAARGLVLGARDQARLALAEIRNLARGIAPAILLDRGLVPALGALAGRNPVPTAIRSTLPAGIRLPDAVERAAYFVVAESLANVAKHASATRCEVRVRPEGAPPGPDGSSPHGPPRLVVETWDDGVGGARIEPGGGLAGLAGRVEALDGTLVIDSPAGGPTIVRAEIPVALAGVRLGPAEDTVPGASLSAAAAARPEFDAGLVPPDPARGDQASR
jgi:signal transduction histidine kinase